ncbi:hypothetical protein RCH09_002411 [Actimicrobium sp. GrIS 1.19]|uniref:hypothetical protein n=1 Tax=Actimicrobium sp. GrIS 1.19 TaxID=3071708 RepID=UPI002E054484|nr:hypothetical protein [Actimicrobium sp. GrIS 1.19]
MRHGIIKKRTIQVRFFGGDNAEDSRTREAALFDDIFQPIHGVFRAVRAWAVTSRAREVRI